jgi:hypothetical protein
MKPSKATLNVLKSFSNVNPNCIFRAGRVLSTVNKAESFVAEATLDTEIETEFGIYDLKEFISALEIVEDPSIEIDNKTAIITPSNGTAKIKYGLADPSILTFPPEKGIKMPPADIALRLTAGILAQVINAAETLKVQYIRLSGVGGGKSVTISTNCGDGTTRNTFSTEVDENVTVASDLTEFMVEFPLDLFKMIRGDYDVTISRSGITQWVHTSEPIKYWIATNTSSEFVTKNAN